MAIKLVRGAYMVFEKEYSEQQNLKNPVCKSYNETSELMNSNLKKLVKELGQKGNVNF